jgi:photosystem II stability/assembly factor-like uncharacterized protein
MPPFPSAWPPDGKGTVYYYAYSVIVTNPMELRQMGGQMVTVHFMPEVVVFAPWARVALDTTHHDDGEVEILARSVETLGADPRILHVHSVCDTGERQEERLVDLMRARGSPPTEEADLTAHYCAWIAENRRAAEWVRGRHHAFYEWLACGRRPAAVPAPPAPVTPSALAVHPKELATVYAGTGGLGVFKTIDAGRTWRSAGTWTPEANVSSRSWINALAIDRERPSVVYAGTGSGLWISHDGGDTWSPAGLKKETVTAVAFDAATPRTLYAGTFGKGLFRSVDGGVNWVASNTGIKPSRFLGPSIKTLSVDPGAGGVLQVGGDIGVYISGNGAVSWTPSTTPPRRDVEVVVHDPMAPGVAYASTTMMVYRSADGGQRWATVSGSGLPDDERRHARALVVVPASPSVLYLGTLCGLYGSSDRGESWRLVAGGLPRDEAVSAIAVDPRDPATIYAAVRGVYRTTDAGQTWTAVRSGLPSSVDFDMTPK